MVWLRWFRCAGLFLRVPLSPLGPSVACEVILGTEVSNVTAKAQTFGGEGGLREVEEAEAFVESAHLLD